MKYSRLVILIVFPLLFGCRDMSRPIRTVPLPPSPGNLVRQDSVYSSDTVIYHLRDTVSGMNLQVTYATDSVYIMKSN